MLLACTIEVLQKKKERALQTLPQSGRETRTAMQHGPKLEFSKKWNENAENYLGGKLISQDASKGVLSYTFPHLCAIMYVGSNRSMPKTSLVGLSDRVRC